MHHTIKKLGLVGTILLSTVISTVAQAADPVVNTTIKLEKTGSEPFDANTLDGADPITAGLDEGVDNNIVRMQDSVTYRVEVSVNDAAVDNLVATVMLPDGKQKWIEIPSGCKTDSAEVTPVSEISADGYTLTCNVGAAIEGTTRVIFPAAKVVSYNEVTDSAVLNAEHTIARVSATAPSANTATAGDTDVEITAGFKVNTTKSLKVTALHPTTGEPLYKAPAKSGPNGEVGTLMEYIIRVRYQNGSMLIDSDEQDFLIDIGLFDAFTDNNTGNDGAFSSGGQLYTWDADQPACSLIGNHGATAAVACTQNNIAADFLSDTAGGSGDFTGSTDGKNDPNIDIALSDIDVRDPDADGNVVEMSINVWFKQISELKTHQSCTGANAGDPCVNTVINSVGTLNAAGDAIEGYNPTSTEDANGTNLLNYNSAGEPFANEIDYPMVYTAPGSASAYKTFTGLFTHALRKAPARDVALGETVPMLIHHYDYRLRNGSKMQTCDKIDTTVFEYQGLRPAGTLFDVRHHSFTRAPTQQWNPAATAWGGAEGTKDFDNTDAMEIYYSDIPNGTGSLDDQRATVCEDDLNGDGIAVVDGVDLATGVAPAGGEPNDWVTDASALAAGMTSVTKIRHTSTYDKDKVTAFYPSHKNWGMVAIHQVKVKGDATAYAPHDYLPNYMTYRLDNTSGVYGSWLGTTAASTSTDPANVNFSLDLRYSDRLHLVPSSIAISKRTEPKGIKVVRAGDLVDFVIEPKVLGAWNPAITTATVTDALPAKTVYVPGSEMFSIDGGATWLNYTDFNATADVIINSPENSGPSLTWDFIDVTPDVNGSDQLPLIKYTVEVDGAVTSGNFDNTAKLDSEIDNNNGDSPVTAKYRISAFPEFGLDLVKRNQFDVYQTNEAFEVELIYKNLGGESYTKSDFIDILPHNTDGVGNSGGLSSSRTPPTTQNGTYKVTKLTGTNGEAYMATDADPTTIPQDPCHEDNLANGEIPVAGDLCYNYYVSSNTAGIPIKLANTLAGGGAAGTGAIAWEACTALGPVVCGSIDPADITAIRFSVPTLPKSAGGKIVKVELTPTGNVGGTPDIDGLGNVTAASTGDVFTNTFSGRVPEISLLVISNDVSVTMVSGSIGDYVWIDQNADGIQDNNEDPIGNVKLKLLDGSGNPIYVDPATGGIVASDAPDAIPYVVETDATGKYSFDNLPAGDYKVEVDTTTLPASVEQTFDKDGVATANISSVTLAPVTDPITGNVTDVEDNDEQDFGYKKLASLGNFVWNDLDNDGVQDVGEAGVDGVTVTLYDSSGAAIGTTVTANGGAYSFDNLDPGTYSVGFSNLPAGFVFTKSNQGNDTKDSDADATTGKTATVTLAAGDNNTTLDAGLFKPASLGNFVWNDKDNDGIQDAGEAGIDGVEVKLYDSSGAVVATTTTANGGAYSFNNLLPGTYSVGFTKPAGYEVTKQNEGDDAKDSDIGADGKTAPVTLTSGENNPTLDAGFFKPGSIGDTIWHDKDNDGEVDSGEGLEGVTVELTKPDGTKVTTTTGPDGKYLFENLPAGDYKVEVIDSSLPAALQGKNTQDPDATKDGKSSLTLGEGEDNLDQDFAYYVPGSIGDTIWHDKNNDGVVDAGEALEGVTVQLTKPDGTKVTATTDADGKYLFEGLIAGDYSVEVLEDSLPEALKGKNTVDPSGAKDSKSTLTLGSGESNLDQDFAYFAPSSIGNTIWHDKNNDGVADEGEGLVGVTVTLSMPDGSTQTTTTDENGKYLFEDLPAGDFTITVDESTLSEALQGKNTVDPNGGNDSVSTVTLDGSSSNLDQDFAYVALGSIGDTIWQDTNHDGVVDAGDTMLSGVTVTLTPPADIDLGAGLGKPITTTTDGDGKYLFPDLPAGNYTVVVDPSTLPAGLANTVDPDGGFNSTSSVALGEGENDLDQDFAYAEVGHISGTVLEDTDADDTGDAPMSNVVLQLLDSNGDPVLDANDNPITTTTDTEGNYQFLNLLPGDYQISQVQPAGYESVSDVDGEAKDNLIGSITVTGGNTEVANDFVELRASPAPPPTGEPIPTLSEWMLMMLALLLLFAGKRESLRFSGRKF